MASARTIVLGLASPRLTVVFFLLMGASGLWSGYHPDDITLATLPPLLLLAVNLLAAIAVHPRLRTDYPLLGLHLALLGFVALMALARLVYFDGVTTLTTGSEFEGRLVREDRGALHDTAFTKLRFSNLGFVERTPSPNKYPKTFNQVSYRDDAGRLQLGEIGDDRPLLLGGYRIYSTGSWGFSPVFTWLPASGGRFSGTAQLGNNDPMRLAFRQGFGPEGAWRLPSGPEVWMVLLADAWPPQSRDGELRDTDLEQFGHRLVMRVGELRHEMRPGDILSLPEGKLVYEKLGTWMGFRLVYDPTTPWIVSTLALGVLSILWFYGRSVWRPRNKETIG